MVKLNKLISQFISFLSISNNDKDKAAICLRIAYPKVFKFQVIHLVKDQCDTLLVNRLRLGFEDSVIRNVILDKYKIENNNLFIVDIVDINDNINLDAPRYLFFKNGEDLDWQVQGDKVNYPVSFLSFISQFGLAINNVGSLYNM